LGDELEDLIVNSMINPTALTKNNKYMQNIFEDRLMIPFVGVKMAKSILQAIDFTNSLMNNFSYPVIVFHGKKDSVVDYEDSKRFVYSKLTAYKQLHLFD
jgi:DNA helicase IV